MWIRLTIQSTEQSLFGFSVITSLVFSWAPIELCPCLRRNLVAATTDRYLQNFDFLRLWRRNRLVCLRFAGTLTTSWKRPGTYSRYGCPYERAHARL